MPKKIWEDEKAGGDAPKMFPGPPNPWASREADAWPNQSGNIYFGRIKI